MGKPRQLEFIERVPERRELHREKASKVCRESISIANFELSIDPRTHLRNTYGLEQNYQKQGE